jgi:hypothetical protein
MRHLLIAAALAACHHPMPQGSLSSTTSTWVPINEVAVNAIEARARETGLEFGPGKGPVHVVGCHQTVAKSRNLLVMRGKLELPSFGSLREVCGSEVELTWVGRPIDQGGVLVGDPKRSCENALIAREERSTKKLHTTLRTLAVQKAHPFEWATAIACTTPDTVGRHGSTSWQDFAEAWSRLGAPVADELAFGDVAFIDNNALLVVIDREHAVIVHENGRIDPPISLRLAAGDQSFIRQRHIAGHVQTWPGGVREWYALQ